jgi:sulfate transport system permease protein
MGVTLTILSLIVLIPLTAVALKAAHQSPEAFWAAAFNDRSLAAYRLTFGAAFVAAAVNGVFGVLTAWALVRYEFPGKTIVNALVDLPFALPTAVAGIALATLYAPKGWVGQFLTPLGIKAAYNPIGVVIALTFIGLPFVVRTIEPVLRDAAEDVEEAAASLGADRLQTIARPGAGLADRLRHGLRPRGGRVRLGDLHRRQHALQVRDRAAADHHPAGTVRV